MGKPISKEERRLLPRVPVLSIDGKPLSPTDVRQARVMVERGVAKRAFINGVFTLQMLREVGTVNPAALSQ